MESSNLLVNESMARHTTLRAGGFANRFFKPKSVSDLQRFIKEELNDSEVFFVGYGSNLLVRDGGFSGVIISLSGACDEVELGCNDVIHAGAGSASARLARFAAENNLCGLEFLAGIPGTIGGALAMNAGANGAETWEYIENVRTINRSGEIRTRSRNEFNPTYRNVDIADDEWFLSASFKLHVCSSQESKQKIEEILKRRRETQPTNKPTCGSVFMNPEGDYAGRLIESSGLKGTCINSACISEKHANFIVNTGGATASDIELLIIKVQKSVQEIHGISLCTELKIIGEGIGGQSE